MSRLLPAVLQLPAAQLGAVHPGARPRRRRQPAALPLRLHRLERQPLRPARHRLQGGRAHRVHRGALRPLHRDTPLARRPAPSRSTSREAFDPDERRAGLRGCGRPSARASFFLNGGTGGGARRRARPRGDLGGAAAPRGLRHQRPAHPALVRPAEPARLARRSGCRWAARWRWHDAPIFQVRAVGSFEQQPGCPRRRRARRSARSGSRASAAASATTRRTQRRRSRASRWCASARSASADEPVAALIEDPWRVLPAASPIPPAASVTLQRRRASRRRDATRSTTRARSRRRARRSTRIRSAASATRRAAA